ncbi:hypothetical protein ODJ79_29135 [Actinoplanes sp. KI2]|uniref:hypothetical protein n=1 Tax=Actinoplanes sp. KI2 TaxID=2983315 RepID=UPI0021D56A4B|nr:hypothetical protein [Actinoplanes sp. KI2]MCU7727800.1 hypothetical protein [Actinoplanes sp. KI2]
MTELSTVDYTDHFSVRTDVPGTAEQWARAMFGNVPSPGEVFIWRVVLGLRLRLDRSPSPETVAGWRIGGRGDDWIRLEAASPAMTANLVVRAGGGEVSLTTLLRYDRAPARLIWPPLSAVHRWLVPRVLRDATARMSRLDE